MAMKYEVLVEVSLREGIADPQGATIERSLPALGFESIESVRVGKAIRFRIQADDASSAKSTVQQVCERLLANPVIEDTAITITEATTGDAK